MLLHYTGNKIATTRIVVIICKLMNHFSAIKNDNFMIYQQFFNVRHAIVVVKICFAKVSLF